MSPTLPRAFPPLTRGWVTTTCHGLTSLGGSWAQSQLAGVRGRGQQGWWKRRGTGTALGGSGVAVDLAVCGWGAHGAPAVWGRDRRSRRRQRSEEKKTDPAASPAWRLLPSPPRRGASGQAMGWASPGRMRGGPGVLCGQGAASPLVARGAKDLRAHGAVAVVPVSGSFSHQPRPWGAPCPGGLVGSPLSLPPSVGLGEGYMPAGLAGYCFPPTAPAPHEPLATCCPSDLPRERLPARPSMPRPPTYRAINARS